VSPLVALAEEQVLLLQRRGFPAVRLTTEVWDEADLVSFGATVAEKICFVVISPETLAKDSIRSKLERFPVVGISVDEGHCVTECEQVQVMFEKMRFLQQYKFISIYRGKVI